ncbi:hypothetical protein DFH07DRAFT_940892 [Mycena maculata]|uniref:Uncharacterized protein n=1 Tax=Mycena maculata TaxID=230809 RepID=A0AAD7J1Z8_9AGAR|nr:hypothetical protein DFH07DRAFT_940892 [Mycena maculata]
MFCHPHEKLKAQIDIHKARSLPDETFKLVSTQILSKTEDTGRGSIGNPIISLLCVKTPWQLLGCFAKQDPNQVPKTKLSKNHIYYLRPDVGMDVVNKTNISIGDLRGKWDYLGIIHTTSTVVPDHITIHPHHLEVGTLLSDIPVMSVDGHNSSLALTIISRRGRVRQEDPHGTVDGSEWGGLLCAEPKEERETSGISRRGRKSGASGRRPEVLLSAVLATPQLRRVPEGVQSDLEEASRSEQTPLEPNANVTDFVEAIHIPDGTRVTGSVPEGGRDSEDARKGTEEAPDEVKGIWLRMQMTGGKNNKDKQDLEVSGRLRNEDEIEGRLSP